MYKKIEDKKWGDKFVAKPVLGQESKSFKKFEKLDEKDLYKYLDKTVKDYPGIIFQEYVEGFDQGRIETRTLWVGDEYQYSIMTSNDGAWVPKEEGGTRKHNNLEYIKNFAKNAMEVSSNNIILVDQYLENAKEIDVDLIRDSSGDIYIAGIMEHIEEAGIHSGDSACSLPPYSINQSTQDMIKDWVSKIANKINVVGLMNAQLALKDNKLYVLEVNPRASRTVPFVAKATGIPIAKIASKVMTGDKLKDLLSFYNLKKPSSYNVKESVFPFNKFDGVDLILGPEMKSTGEVMGIDESFLSAYIKSQLAAGNDLPSQGTVFLSIDDDNKKSLLPIASKLSSLNFDLIATKGTAKYLKDNNIIVKKIKKVKEGNPNVVNALTSNQIQLVINTTKTQGSIRDSYSIRRTSMMFNIPYYTTIAGARVAVDAIEHLKNNQLIVKSLQSIH